MFKTGWAWNETRSYDNKTYTMQLQPYVEPQIHFTLDVMLKRIVHAQVTANLGKFRISLLYRLLFSWAEGQVCSSVGYEIDSVGLNVTYGYLIYTCYMGVASDLLDWSTIWAGKWN